MVRSHRSVFDRLESCLGNGVRRGVLLDTPFGFQTNARELAERSVAYFAKSVGAELEVAGMRRMEDLEGPRGDTIVSLLVSSPLVFAGPGSPSYALRHWHGTLVPALLAEKLALGGAITFSSAAALTLGSLTVPVYEIYKVGEDPRWLQGLDLLAPLGLRAAVIPHYDNAEGGTHDTRYCYLGEERLSLLERDMPEDTFVLGVDEHTALHLDLSSGTAEVTGHGGVTLRARGASERLEAGTTSTVDRLAGLAQELGRGRKRRPGTGGEGVDERNAGGTGTGGTGTGGTGTSGADLLGVPGDASGGGTSREKAQATTLLQAIREREEAFRQSLQAGDPGDMAAQILSLHEDLLAWSSDTLQSDHLDRGKASLRSMALDLASLAEIGARDPEIAIRPYVELLLEVRAAARAAGRFEEADRVRDSLEALGIELRDRPEATSWQLHARESPEQG